MKPSIKVMLLVIVVLGFSTAVVCAQNNKSDAAKTPVSLKNGGVYKFSANYAYPLSGRSKYLNPTYDVVFSKDTLDGHLPYFGTATSVPYGSNDGGVNFQTSSFTFEESAGKKESYKIHYKIKEGNDVSDATFTIYKDGTADLLLTFLRRQSISYRGNVINMKPKG